MNPLTKVKLINELNEREADLGISEAVSWHSEYRDSAWIFVGGFPYELTEGDLICVFSQYGEIVNINLVRDKKTGKSKGFCFVCYEDQRSTVLAVDNFNGIKIKGRTIRVDHVKSYRPPKDHEDIDDVTKRLREDGCAPREPAAARSEDEEQQVVPVKKAKKDKKEKKKKKKEKKEKKKSRESSSSADSSPRHPSAAVRVKEEKQDAAYDKYNQQGAPQNGQRDREDDRRRRRDGDDDRRREDRGRDTNRDDGRRRDADGDKDRGERWRETDRDDGRRRDRDDRRRRRWLLEACFSSTSNVFPVRSLPGC
ncbi:LOW QUALITY PROTEIN: RNA-binding motif protein, X-linked 2 [Anableps anableps]